MRKLDTKAVFDLHLMDNADRLTVIDFTASWCGPCQRVTPIFEAISKEPAFAHVSFAKVDINENAETAKSCGVENLPTFMFFKHGTKVHEFSGTGEQKLRAAIESHK